MSSPIDYIQPQPEPIIPQDLGQKQKKTRHGKKHPRQEDIVSTAKTKIPKAPPLERGKTRAPVSPLPSFRPETQIPKQAELFKLSRQLKSQKAPLKPADTERDIYFAQEAVFKPGDEASTKATICYGLLEINGLGDSIPPAKPTVIKEVVAAQDLNVEYVRVKGPKGRNLIVDKNALYAVTKKNSKYVYQEGAATYHFSKSEKPGIYVAKQVGKKHSDFEDRLDDEFILVVDPENRKKRCFVPVESRSRVHCDDHGDYVLRNGQKYRLETRKGKLQVIGKDIQGMIQSKVLNTYIGSSDIRGGVLDLRSTMPKVEQFFNRIDMPSFIDAFIATILLRPHDGKVALLNESNVLFQALPNQAGTVDPQDPACLLKPVLIDLDEAMPSGVDHVLAGNEEGIHSVRNGLMGFPQTQVLLKGVDRKRAIDLMRVIIDRQQEAGQFLGKFTESNQFGKEHLEAYDEVVSRLESFLETQSEKPFSLQDLFFHVFPHYKEQWDMIGDQRPPIIKAELIGYQSDEQIAFMIKSR